MTTFIVNQAGLDLYGGAEGLFQRMRERNATKCRVLLKDLGLVFGKEKVDIAIHITNTSGCYIANDTLYNTGKVKGDIVIAIINAVLWITRLDLNIVTYYSSATVPMRPGLISINVQKDYSGDLSSWARVSRDTLRHLIVPNNSVYNPMLPHVRTVFFEGGTHGSNWNTPEVRQVMFGKKPVRMHTYYPATGKVHVSRNIDAACVCYANCAKDHAAITLALVMRAYRFPRDIRLLVLHGYVRHISSDAWTPPDVIWNVDGTVCYSSSELYDFLEHRKRWDEVKAAKRIYKNATKKKNVVEGKLKRKQYAYEEAEIEESKAHVEYLEKMKSIKTKK